MTAPGPGIGFRKRVDIGTRRFYLIITREVGGQIVIHKTLPAEHRVGKRPGQRRISPQEAQVLKAEMIAMIQTLNSQNQGRV